jgi:hypothetical protein
MNDSSGLFAPAPRDPHHPSQRNEQHDDCRATRDELARLDRDAEAVAFQADPEAALGAQSEPVVLDEWRQPDVPPADRVAVPDNSDSLDGHARWLAPRFRSKRVT